MYLALSVFMGTIPIIWLENFPNIFYVLCLLISLLFILCFSRHELLRKIIILSVILFLTFIWSYLYCQQILSWSLEPSLEGVPLVVIGRVESLVQEDNFGQHFILKTEKINHESLKVNLKLSSTLSNLSIFPGEKWCLMVTLSKARWNLNPGGFDIEKWYFINQIPAKGKVNESTFNQCLEKNTLSFGAIRQIIYRKLDSVLKKTDHFGVMASLIIGHHNDLTQKENRVFRNTGTAHLMAISGLHVGLISTGCFFIAYLLFGMIPWCFLYIPRQSLSAIAALLGAFLYSSLAGFSFSTQRALVMLCCVLLRYWMPWKMSFLDAISLAFVLVVLCNPLAILDTGFWLSFCSVGILGYAIVYQEHKNNFWHKWGRAQWVCSIGLLPITCWYFQQFPLLGFFANLVAIPWVSFIVLPLGFLGTFLLFINQYLAIIALKLSLFSFSLLFQLLLKMSSDQFVVINPIPEFRIFIFSMIGVWLMLSPYKVIYRSLGILFFIPLFFTGNSKPKFGESKITVLDVGQGLATVVQTKNHILIFDTGAKLSNEHDAGTDIVIPFLRINRIKHIHTMVLSHGDNDHIGGARSILAHYTVDRILTSAPEKLIEYDTQECRAGQKWIWDGLSFEIINPTPASNLQGNDASCVLKLSSSSNSVLFTGDIEETAEKRLITSYGDKLRSTVLIAPHHGSKTSSSAEFMSKVHPSLGVFSYGYRNRYHHPSLSVIQRYHDNQVRIVDTVSGGAIEISLGDELKVQEYRKSHKHLWSG